MRTVHFVVPDGVDDPTRPSGGNVYDLRVRRGLEAAGWTVHVHEVASRDVLAGTLARIHDGALVLVDGLIAAPTPDTGRLHVVVLVHMPHGDAWERAALSTAAAVVTTSAWTKRALLQLHGLGGERIHVAEPGVERAELAPGTATAGSLLSVAAVIPGKGHDVLLDALATLRARHWRWTCVGSLDRDPAFAERLRRRAAARGLADRIRFTGPLAGAELARSYGAADVLVLPSRGETYGMVVTEALARGLPVVAADVGGVPEALGRGDDGTAPGLLVPPDDPAALGDALHAWLHDPALRHRLRGAARERRRSLVPWTATADAIANVLAGASR